MHIAGLFVVSVVVKDLCNKNKHHRVLTSSLVLVHYTIEARSPIHDPKLYLARKNLTILSLALASLLLFLQSNLVGKGLKTEKRS